MDEPQFKFVSERPDSKEFYSLHRKLLKIIYQWPGQNPLFRKVFLCLSTMMTTAALTGVLLKLEETDDMDLIVQCISITSAISAGLLNQFTILYKKKSITEMNNLMFDDWDNICFRGEKKIFRKYGKYARFAAQFIVGYAIFTAVAFVSVSIPTIVMNIVKPLNVSRDIPTIAEMEFGINQANHQIPFLIYIYISVWCTISTLVCYDTSYTTYIIHNCALFEVTGYTFEYLLYNRNEETLNDYKEKKRTLGAIWQRAVNFHHKAFQFNDLVEETFTYPCAIELILCTLQSSLCMMHVIYSLDKKEYHETFRYAVFVGSQFIRLFINILPGQMLMDSSNNFYTSVYNGDWHFLPLNYQKMIVIVLAKASKTSYVTASKLFILGFEIFTVWVKTVVSYFTIALSLNKAK
ncbi:odorant receptor 85b-like isoform X2 [Prorops nasuta]|uniref:odorant receptor 85b-like isoform X2 n=1 Tax=Prorops nasuta TaxID=863751 RepID=UPI0034CEFC7F